MSFRHANNDYSGAGVTTTGLWHYLANITDPSIAKEFAQFSAATADGYKTKSTAGVINKIKGREQVRLHVIQEWFYVG